MTGLGALGAAAAACVLGARAGAQEPASRGRRITLAVTPSLMVERDENASPVRYSGAVAQVQLGYGTRADRRWLAVRLGGGRGTLRSAQTGASDLPRQQALRAVLDVEHARVVGNGGGPTRWLVGGLLAARLTVIDHFYADPLNDQLGYAMLTVAVGPLIAVERAAGSRGTWSVRAGAPLVALVGRSYSDIRLIPRGGLPVRVAAPHRFQALDLSAVYATRLGRGADATVGYRLVVERYEDAQPFRFASQGISLAIAVRLGGDG